MRLGLVAQVSDNLGPGFGPAVTTGDGAQSKHRIDMGARPMHATTFEACLDDQLIRALDGAIADRPAGLLKGGVAHLGAAFFQIGQGASQLWLIGPLSCELTQDGEEGIEALRFELMELLL